MAFAKTRKILQQGTRAAQPAASSVQEGTLYYVTDESVIERSNLTTWDGWATSGSGTVTHTGALTSGKTVVGNGAADITVSSLTATVVKSATGTLSAATGGTDYTDLAFKTIAVSGQSDVVADTAADTLTLAAGANVTITTNAGTDTVTIAATGGGGSGTVTNTGTLTSGKTIIGNGGVDVTVSSLTANLVASSSGTLAGALAAANSKLVGSGASGSGSAYSELTLGTNLSMSGTTLNAAGGSSGALTLLEQHTASSSATLDFTTFYSSTYDSYLFQFLNVVPATDGTDFYMKVSTDGGSTWSASTYKYSYTYESIGGGTTGQINSGGAIAQWILAGAISSTAASAGICGELHLYNPGGSSANKVIDFNVVIAHSGGVGTFQYDGAGTWETTTAVNAVQFLFSSGNLASGTVRAYGLSK